jgi:hypothetical protein
MVESARRWINYIATPFWQPNVRSETITIWIELTEYFSIVISFFCYWLIKRIFIFAIFEFVICYLKIKKLKINFYLFYLFVLVLITNVSMCACNISKRDFFFEATPSEKASFGLHNISWGMTFKLSNALRIKCFSTRCLVGFLSSTGIEK